MPDHDVPEPDKAIRDNPQIPPDVQALSDLIQTADLTGAADYDAAPLDALEACRRVSVGRRVAGVYQLVISGLGATVAAATTRSLLESAMETLWHEGQPAHTSARLGSLSFERAGLVSALVERDLSVPTIQRWLQPGPFWRLNGAFVGPGAPSGKRLADRRKTAVGNVLGASPAVADLLAMAGHANQVAAWCTVSSTDETSLGYTATPAYRAIFTQAAGRSAAYALRGTQLGNLEVATRDLSDAARSIHRLPARGAPGTITMLPANGKAYLEVVEPEQTSLIQDQLLEQVRSAYENFYELLCQGPDPYRSHSKELYLEPVLPYLTCISTAEVVLHFASGRLSAEVGVTAARMLLEEGARTHWTFGEGYAATVTRYPALRNAQTRARADLRSKLRSHGASDEAINALLDPLPREQLGSDVIRPIPPGQDAAVPPYEQMRGLGVGFPEPNWLTLAYSLLSQVAHATPLGLLHAVARHAVDEPTMSHEMTALALDVAAIGTATTACRLAALVALKSGQAFSSEWTAEMNRAALLVHRAAQVVHFLD